MNFERCREEHAMETIRDADGNKIGHITLDHLANPEGMIISLQGSTVIPDSFDELGHPNFTKQRLMLYAFANNEYKHANARNGNKESKDLELSIRYDAMAAPAIEEFYNSTTGIEKVAGTDLYTLNQMLTERKRYAFIQKKNNLLKPLHEFALFGRYKLCSDGTVVSFYNPDRKYATVELIDDKNDPRPRGKGHLVIPKVDSVCPFCGKKADITSVWFNPFVYVDKKYAHANCLENFEWHDEVDYFRTRIMAHVYNDEDFSRVNLPSTGGDCHYMNLPWFQYFTPDGSIIIGRKFDGTIRIEWCSDYRPFNANEVFSMHGIKVDTQFNEVFALSTEQAIEYLTLARKAVNPNYKLR